MLEKKIAFLPYKLHFRHFLFALAEKMPLTVFLPPEKSLPENSKLHGVSITYKQFGADIIKPFIGKEIRTLKYVAGLSKFLRQEDFDVLLTCEFYHWYTFQCVAYKKRSQDFKLFVVVETKRWPRNFVARVIKKGLWHLFKMNLKYVDGFVVYTTGAEEFLKKYAPGKQITLLPTPINPEMFKYNATNVFLRDGQLRLLMNARYSPYKRHKDIFEALKRLNDKGKQVHLTCISRDGRGREDIVALAKTMRVSKQVDFLDPLPLEQMPKLLYGHDALILPSYNEAIGMVVPEAMGCGIPTITSDTVGANVYVLKDETGFIFETGNIEAVTNTIERCFDASLLRKMGERAHKHIEKSFTPETVVRRFEELLKKHYE